MANWFGYNMPFLTDGAVLPIQMDERLIKNDLLQLLLTVPGERVMRPTFGTAIRTTVFELNDDQTLSSLRQDIANKIAEFEKRITVTDIDLIPTYDKNLLTIKIFGSLNKSEDSRKEFLFEIGVPIKVEM